MTLSDVQFEAARHPDHLALTSCPGSGKTRTLVAKLLHALDEVQGTTRLVSCLTYTNTAVYEIEARLSQLTAAASSLCEIETIHSFCLKHIVAPHSWRLPQFANGFRLLVPDEPEFAEIAADVVQRFSLVNRASGEFEQLSRGTGAYPDSIRPRAAEAFWAELDCRCVMDFSSIIYWANQLVQSTPYIARALASRYQWILVDEFQDTSSLQVDILRAVHRHARTKFFIVGDPHQSIMSFAGARPDLLATFGTEIGARSDLRLLANYRSSRRILELADRLCPRDAPMLAYGNHCDHPHLPVWHAVPTMLEGISSLFIPELHKYGVSLSKAAVLACRWTSLLPLSRGLREQAIPVIGPGARPYRRSHHVIAPLIEEIAGQVIETTSPGATQVRREVGRLVQTTTNAGRSNLGFAGDVCAVRLVHAARQLAEAEDGASEFLISIARVIARELSKAGFLSPGESELIVESARAMLEDIERHEEMHHLRTTTVRDLGLFARESNSIRLMTMHGSKGREFDAVALIDVFDGHVPFFAAKPGDELEDEGRRLLYVSLTRAKKILMIFTLSDFGSRNVPSRFLCDLFPGGTDTLH